MIEIAAAPERVADKRAASNVGYCSMNRRRPSTPNSVGSSIVKNVLEDFMLRRGARRFRDTRVMRPSYTVRCRSAPLLASGSCHIRQTRFHFRGRWRAEELCERRRQSDVFELTSRLQLNERCKVFFRSLPTNVVRVKPGFG